MVQRSLVKQETVQSARAAKFDDSWDPSRVEYTFTAWGECRHPTCKQRFAIAGIGGVDIDQGVDGELEWSDYFQPRSCSPMPDLFEIPPKCPEPVSKEIRAAFKIFWLNHAACAGRLRVSLEHLMDHVGAPKRKRNAAGRFYELSLHARIDAYAKNEPTIGPNLIALKWLGNSGSHVGEVNKAELLEALEIMEHSLGEIIDKRSERVAQLAKKLTKKHRRKT